MVIDCIKIFQYKNINDHIWKDLHFGSEDIKTDNTARFQWRYVLRIVGVIKKQDGSEVFKTLVEEPIKDLPESVTACQIINFMGVDYLYFPNILNGQICLQSTRTTI